MEDFYSSSPMKFGAHNGNGWGFGWTPIRPYNFIPHYVGDNTSLCVPYYPSITVFYCPLPCVVYGMMPCMRRTLYFQQGTPKISRISVLSVFWGCAQSFYD